MYNIHPRRDLQVMSLHEEDFRCSYNNDYRRQSDDPRIQYDDTTSITCDFLDHAADEISRSHAKYVFFYLCFVVTFLNNQQPKLLSNTHISWQGFSNCAPNQSKATFDNICQLTLIFTWKFLSNPGPWMILKIYIWCEEVKWHGNFMTMEKSMRLALGRKNIDRIFSIFSNTWSSNIYIYWCLSMLLCV